MSTRVEVELLELKQLARGNVKSNLFNLTRHAGEEIEHALDIDGEEVNTAFEFALGAVLPASACLVLLAMLMLRCRSKVWRRGQTDSTSAAAEWANLVAEAKREAPPASKRVFMPSRGYNQGAFHHTLVRQGEGEEDDYDEDGLSGGSDSGTDDDAPGETDESESEDNDQEDDNGGDVESRGEREPEGAGAADASGPSAAGTHPVVQRKKTKKPNAARAKDSDRARKAALAQRAQSEAVESWGRATNAVIAPSSTTKGRPKAPIPKKGTTAPVAQGLPHAERNSAANSDKIRL